MAGYGLVQIYPPVGLPYDFGTVTAITDTLNKSIAVTEIVSLPTDCTFALESQTSNSYSIHFIRRNPYKSDGTTYEDHDLYDTSSWMWTNEKWVRGTSALINRWQAQSDGYIMHINVARDIYGMPKMKIDENGVMTKDFMEYTDLYPITVKNIYIKSISYSYSAGDTDTISGILEVVVGGKMTYKAATSTGNKIVNYRLLVIEKGMKQLAVLPAGETEVPTYTPLYATGDNRERCYNACNEYVEYITKADKIVTLKYVSGGQVIEVPLLKGTNASENDMTEYDEFGNNPYEDELNVIKSYSIQGGPSYPFESISLTINMKRLSAEYPEVIDNVKEGEIAEEDGYRIIPGVSEIFAKAVGYGTYIVTEYKSSEASMTLKGYCKAAIFTAITWPEDMRLYTDAPWRLIHEVLTTRNYGLSTPYTFDRIITNIIGKEGFTDTRILIKSGVNLWQVLGTLAMMCKARMFFTSERVYIVDYTQISDYSETSPARDWFNSSDSDYSGGNRLWIRDGTDFGYTPNPDGSWDSITEGMDEAKKKATEYQYDSLELHSSRIESRIGGRVNGSVKCPNTSEQQIINSITIKYTQDTDSGRVQRTFKVGPMVKSTVNIDYYGEIIDGDINEKAIPESYYKEIAERGRRCYEDIGEQEQVIDLTSLFDSLSDDVVRAYTYSMMAYHLEYLREISFTLAENYPPQSAANTKSDPQIKYAFWSPIFPKVCAVKRFTDIDQDLVISSLSKYDENPTYRAEKLYLSSYKYTYPEQQTDYTFGEVTPVSLANNTTQTQVMLQSR